MNAPLPKSAFEAPPGELAAPHRIGVPERPTRVRTIWVSDVHLGTPDCKAEYLLEFLRCHECETLYLVGDIIDGWQLKKTWYWKQEHNDVLQKILRKARKGTKVIYVPGNHDELLRPFLGVALGRVSIQDSAVHVLADGRRLLVIHGDLFDGVIQHAKWLARLGDELYMMCLKLNRWFNHVRIKLGFNYWSLSQYMKLQVKDAVSFIFDFKHALIGEARRRGLDGVVCGHIHSAEITMVDGILYCNDGDWVESMTALVEDLSGELKIVHWTKRAEPRTQAVAKGKKLLPMEHAA
ncbi:MAG: UDP-2,3-diacylglucosamine diphosphatase [Burkholderiales bacterium]